MKKKPLVIFLIGPTASGKTAVAIELAKMINGEIISADSMQVYKQMNILSAKPTKEQRQQVPHHLISIIEPKEEYSAAVFRSKALECIEDIVSRGNTPLIVGGTGLYVKALVKGIFDDSGKDEQLRKDLAKEAKHHGIEFLYDRLKQVDPDAALKIHPNDLRRIVRALEVYEVVKRPISQLKTEIEGLDSKYDYKIFAIARDRKKLYQRIEQRVDQMFEQGIMDEVKHLLTLNLSHTAKQALGIKQIELYLKKEYSLDRVKELIKRDSRRYAKRQLTWFRADESIIWLDADDETTSKQLAEKIISLLSL